MRIRNICATFTSAGREYTRRGKCSSLTRLDTHRMRNCQQTRKSHTWPCLKYYFCLCLCFFCFFAWAWPPLINYTLM